MNSRPFLPLFVKPLLPLVFLAATTSLFAAAAQAQTPPASTAPGPTPPTLTFTPDGSGAGTLNGQAVTYQSYLFSITGFSNVASDPSNAYTIYSLSNSSLESSPNFYQIASFGLPAGYTFSDTSDFIISTDAIGIHATDPTFGIIVYQTAGTPVISPSNAPFTVYHQTGGVNPFTNPDGSPLIITAQAVPEASSVVSLGLLLLAGAVWQARRLRRQRL